MPLIIGGHVRSGTTLVRNLCNGHPDVAITMEFDNFTGLGSSYKSYCRQMVGKWWRNRHRSFLVQGSTETQRRNVLQSHQFVAQYLLALARTRGECIDLASIEAALDSIFPRAHVVGDKMPLYLRHLDRLADVDGLACIVTYRDCRDVTSSTLSKVRADWRHMAFIEQYNTAEKVASTWVRAIELMEAHAHSIHVIRYEDLVGEPDMWVKTIGDWLNVDPGGFPSAMIHDSSVGNYARGLSVEELASVLEVAGPTMARLGYL